MFFECFGVLPKTWPNPSQASSETCVKRRVSPDHSIPMPDNPLVASIGWRQDGPDDDCIFDHIYD